MLCAAGLAMVGGTITEELHSPMSDLFSLQGRSALITGGSRGIGRMIATGFLRQGARVYISARKAQACLETAKELSALGTCVALPHDVSTVEGAHALAAAYRERGATKGNTELAASYLRLADGYEVLAETFARLSRLPATREYETM